MRVSAPAVTALMIGCVGAPSFGQTVEPGTVTWNVSVRDAEPYGVKLYRSYVETASIELVLTLTNESAAPVSVDQAALRASVHVHLLSEDVEIPTGIEWLPEVWPPKIVSARPIVTNLVDSVLLAQASTFRWILRVERLDGHEFIRGQYVLVFTMADLNLAFRTVAGEVWNGRMPANTGAIALVVTPPSNPRELAAMHELTARNAISHDNPDAALEAFRRAMEADPSYLGAKLGVARMNTALDRYGDAIRMYEAVLQEQLPAETFRAVSEDLAYVQVTAGDVGGAGLTLRAAGLSEEAVASKLAQIIAAAAERFTR